MSRTRAADLRARVRKLWDRGQLPAALVTGEPLFPKRLVLKGPGAAEISQQFEAVRAWIAELQALPYYRLELREFRHRLFGANALPRAVWVDSAEDALALIGKQRG